MIPSHGILATHVDWMVWEAVQCPSIQKDNACSIPSQIAFHCKGSVEDRKRFFALCDLRTGNWLGTITTKSPG